MDKNAQSYILQAAYIAPMEDSDIISMVNEDINNLLLLHLIPNNRNHFRIWYHLINSGEY
jgi:hypothetical protein